MTDVAQSGETLADRVERVLRKRQLGPLSVTELIKELAPDEDASATTLAAEHQLVQALREDELRRTARGKRPRFGITDGESVRLRPPGNPAEAAVEQWNEKVKQDLLEQLRECDPIVFEHIVAQLLIAIGYEEVRVTKRSNDGGIDVHAILSARGVTRVPTALQVKRWRKPVGRPEVQRLRGSLKSTQQGVIVTTSHFAGPAIKDAARQDGNPVHLIDGRMLADLMAEHGFGVQTSRVAFFSLDEQLLTGGLHATPSATDDDQVSPAARQGGQKFFLAQLPGGRSADYLSTLAAMARLAEAQPSLDDYIALFQKQFPSITRADEARRRMRVLLSLGLAEIESDHVTLTFKGRRFLDDRDPRLLGDAFLSRIAGAVEVRDLVSDVVGESARRQLVREDPPAGLSSTQAALVLRWLTQLGLVK
ncbi:restriction endonuclease [Streptomyces sp. D2-8]|uniref:restriction endonuclease n=1 Tax=Streptomyces sp. D2-8 TaxID=2707767 RepID=UPI0020BE5F7C|nr:restriction endonuclease [Streptomyces sp. D2-8]MCK8431904.1 restriction endonuclease [Streptomyces sp. D2-8]